jgi:SAM-dependent methyltransferase
MTSFWLDAEMLPCIDILPESVAHTQEQYGDRPNMRVLRADIADLRSIAQIGEAAYDTVSCINVLEHIDAHEHASSHMLAALEPGGHLLLFVPAGRYLFGTLDIALGHFRWLFNLMTPAFVWIEERWRPPFGQSAVCFARRPRA